MKPYSDRSLLFILSLTILVLALSGCKELLAVSTAASPSPTPEQPTATAIQPTNLPTQTLTATQKPSPKPTATSTTTPTSIPTEPAATELENVGGDQLIFGSFREGNYDIFVMNPDGSGQRNLTQGAEFSSYFPAWSPDRTKIAFSAQFMLIAYIAVMDADGSTLFC